MADTQITGTLSVDNAINGSLSANEGINGSLTPDEEISGTLEVTRTRVVATMLSELEDVELDDLQDDDILVYDSLDGKWHNEANAGGGTWGTITGTLSDQTDLQAALDNKYNRSEANVLGAKNLLPKSKKTTDSKNGIDFTFNADGSVTFSGTASDVAEAYFDQSIDERLLVSELPPNMIVSGSDSSNSKYGIEVVYRDSSNDYI